MGSPDRVQTRDGANEPSPSLADAIRRRAEDPWLTLGPILAVALTFRVVDLGGVTVLNDEPQDLPAVLAHADEPNPFALSEYLQRADPSQSRLPYYLTAIGIRLLSEAETGAFWGRGGRVDTSPRTGQVTLIGCTVLVCVAYAFAAPWPFGRWAGLLPAVVIVVLCSVFGWPKLPMTQLAAARVVAAVIGALGVAAAYLLTRDMFDHWAGVLAATALSMSMMHIGWSRCAVTTGDVFLATFFTLALWLAYRTVRDGSGRAMMGCAATMGLAVGAKLSAVLLWPIVGIYILLARRGMSGETSERDAAVPERAKRLDGSLGLHAALAVALAIVFLWPKVFPDLALPVEKGRLWLWLACLGVYAAGMVWLCGSAWRIPSGRKFRVMASVLAGGGVVAAFATPYHLRLEAVEGLIAWWREFGAREGHRPNYVIDQLSIVELLLLHARLPMNVFAVGGIVWGLRRGQRHWGLLMLITLGLYSLVITVLHQKAVYYLMPLLVLLLVIGSGAFMAFFRRLYVRRTKTSCVVLGILVVSLGAQAVRAARFHPHYLLADVDWYGLSSLSPKLAPGNLQFQGARAAVRWLVENGRSGSWVAVLFPDEHARRAFDRLALAVLTFELQRAPEANSKVFRFTSARKPPGLAGSRYAVAFSAPERLEGPLAGFERVLVHEDAGVTTVWLYARRSDPGQPSAPAP